MRVKRFVGDTVAETMGKVKKELGSDAVILQTRQFKEGGFLGLFGRPRVEVMAAIEEEPVRKKEDIFLKPNTQGSFPNSRESFSNSQGSYTTLQDSLNKDSETGTKSSTASAGGINSLANRRNSSEGSKNFYPRNPYADGTSNGVSNGASSKVHSLEAEFQEMRKLLENMNRQIEGLDGDQGVYPEPLQKWASLLRERGIEGKLVKRLMRNIQQNVREEDWAIDQRVRACLKENIRQICANTAAIQPGVRKPRIVALIGPTGVGKTTTIGKLAAGFSIVDKRKVALITADTYRVAAVEQLKTFGEIIGVPVDVVMTPSGLKEAIQQHWDKELIFIDTAGRSPHHDLHMSELRAFLEKAEPELTMLVMSAATQSSDLAKIYERFEPLTTHLIFTKLDETVSGGTILNLLDKVNLPVAYITNGQNVPDDIEVATPERLTRYILGEEDRRE
ncbi:MAG: flagellar biosynthesis protein FlhF [Desulfitobacterium sp.]|nr:flagellar biosynthesis protein FlhF [Desulfitobacterium sp.]